MKLEQLKKLQDDPNSLPDLAWEDLGRELLDYTIALVEAAERQRHHMRELMAEFMNVPPSQETLDMWAALDAEIPGLS